MTYHIWQLSVILSFIPTVVPGKVKIGQFNCPVKLFVDKDSKSNFTTNIITFFNKVSKNGYQIIYADGANMCSRADIQFVLKTLTTTQITIILNEHINRPCEVAIERGVILQFFKIEDFITVHFINQGFRMPNIRFHDNEVDEIERFLNDVCMSIESNVRRRRQVRRTNDRREDEENSGTTATLNLWVIVLIAVIICLGFIIIITLFYVDHRKNLKRIAALGKELMESTRSKTRTNLPPEMMKKQQMDDEDKKEKELRKIDKAKKEGVDKVDEKNDESSKTLILNARHVPLFVRDVSDIANFCLGYGGTEEVVKRDTKTIVSGTISKDNIGPNETSSSPVAIIDELETSILPMFQQSPKMRSHSFFPGVQSLADILIEFGCNLLAARGFITDGSPGMLELEMVATSWVGKALGLPSCFLPGRKTRGGGLLLTTTTEGMFTAILAARQKKLREILNANATGCGKEKSHANEEDFLLNNMVAYGCSEAHLSFDFGCRLAKVEDKLISPDAEYTMNVDELEHEIMEDVKNKRTPVFINATFGSAHSCSLDKLDEITKIAKKYNIWVHVDASYAGNYLVCPSYRSLINGLENANSISVNLHKCLTQSSHTTFFWTTDLRAVKDSIPQSQNMLKMLHC
uniref:Aromatic-L-amino-acid decarboxylase n=1 Tax=Ascaris suum TaxID=6253 RepID=F1L1E3_ASCSU